MMRYLVFVASLICAGCQQTAHLHSSWERCKDHGGVDLVYQTTPPSTLCKDGMRFLAAGQDYWED